MKGSHVTDLVPVKIEMELSIGDTIQVGNQFLTVVDIEGEEILFQLDSEDPQEQRINSSKDTRTRPCR